MRYNKAILNFCIFSFILSSSFCFAGADDYNSDITLVVEDEGTNQGPTGGDSNNNNGDNDDNSSSQSGGSGDTSGDTGDSSDDSGNGDDGGSGDNGGSNGDGDNGGGSGSGSDDGSGTSSGDGDDNDDNGNGGDNNNSGSGDNNSNDGGNEGSGDSGDGSGFGSDGSDGSGSSSDGGSSGSDHNNNTDSNSGHSSSGSSGSSGSNGSNGGSGSSGSGSNNESNANNGNNGNGSGNEGSQGTSDSVDSFGNSPRPLAGTGDFTLVISNTQGVILNGQSAGGATSDSGGLESVVDLMRGETYNIAIEPEDGYVLKDVIVNGVHYGVTYRLALEDVGDNYSVDIVVEPSILYDSECVGYVRGYSDNTLRPDSEVTRAEVSVMLYRLSSKEAHAVYDASTSWFNDCADSYASVEIAMLDASGILQGYGDGTFRPNGHMTRAELVAALSRFTKWTDVLEPSAMDKELDFSDIDQGHWAYSMFKYAISRGYVDGYPDGTLRPDDYIARSEVVKMINAAVSVVGSNMDRKIEQMKKYTDIGSSHWAYGDFTKAIMIDE